MLQSLLFSWSSHEERENRTKLIGKRNIIWFPHLNQLYGRRNKNEDSSLIDAVWKYLSLWHGDLSFPSELYNVKCEQTRCFPVIYFLPCSPTSIHLFCFDCEAISHHHFAHSIVHHSLIPTIHVIRLTKSISNQSWRISSKSTRQSIGIEEKYTIVTRSVNSKIS